MIPAIVSVVILVVAVKESTVCHPGGERRRLIQRKDLTRFAAGFWWSIAIANLFSLARFSQAFLVLKVFDVGVDAAFVPIIVALTHLVYSTTAYPFGVLADHFDRRLLLACGAFVLVCADVILAAAGSVWITVLGAAFWGLQWGMTQGLLAALVADAAPDRLRGTAFGIYDLAIGTTTFTASAGAGVLWTIGGSALTFAAGGCIAAAAGCMLVLRPIPKPLERRS